MPSAPASLAARTASFIWPRICGSPSTMGIQAAGHAERMAHGIVVLVVVQVRAQGAASSRLCSASQAGRCSATCPSAAQ